MAKIKLFVPEEFPVFGRILDLCPPGDYRYISDQNALEELCIPYANVCIGSLVAVSGNIDSVTVCCLNNLRYDSGTIRIGGQPTVDETIIGFYSVSGTATEAFTIDHGEWSGRTEYVDNLSGTAKEILDQLRANPNLLGNMPPTTSGELIHLPNESRVRTTFEAAHRIYIKSLQRQDRKIGYWKSLEID